MIRVRHDVSHSTRHFPILCLLPLLVAGHEPSLFSILHYRLGAYPTLYPTATPCLFRMAEYCQCARDGFVDVDDGERFFCAECSLESSPTGADNEDPHGNADKFGSKERDIFLALETMPIFKKTSGCNAVALKKAIKKRRGRESVQKLIGLYGEDDFFSTAEKIRQAGAFGSAEMAAELFARPSLETSQGSKEDDGKNQDGDEPEPVYLTGLMRSRLLVALDTTLKHVCYNFLEHEMPETLRAHGWGCAEGAGLGAMLAVVRVSWARKVGGLSVDARVLDSVEGIEKGEWQACITAGCMVRVLQDAETFGSVLGGKEGGEAIRVLRSSIESKLDEFMRKKRGCQWGINETQSRFAVARAKLDEEEKQIMDDLKKQEESHDREMTMGIIGGVRNADDILLRAYLGLG